MTVQPKQVWLCKVFGCTPTIRVGLLCDAGCEFVVDFCQEHYDFVFNDPPGAVHWCTTCIAANDRLAVIRVLEAVRL